MKRLFSLVALLPFAALAVPSVGNVTLSQDAATGAVTISYDLNDGPAIVTLDLKIGGRSLDAELLWEATGDVNRMVSGDTTHQIVWRPTTKDVLAKEVVAEVSAWAPSDPPDYLLVDLVVPGVANYYATSNAIPGGVLAEANMTRKMLFKRVKARDTLVNDWYMGSEDGETGRTKTKEAYHKVTLSQDFWMGVFPVTQSQYLSLKGGATSSRAAQNAPFNFYYERDWRLRPAEHISYNEIRHGTTKDTASPDDYWPNPPNGNSWLGLLRKRVGNELAFDLPSEAQWEFACKAGTGKNQWNTGKAITQSTNCPNEPGRCQLNGGGTIATSQAGSVTASNGTATVIWYEPSLWGFYAFHGSVAEMCLDWYADDVSTLTADPVNVDRANPSNLATDKSVIGSVRVCRGGFWWQHSNYARSASRDSTVAQNTQDSTRGFRVMAPIPAPAE